MECRISGLVNYRKIGDMIKLQKNVRYANHTHITHQHLNTNHVDRSVGPSVCVCV